MPIRNVEAHAQHVARDSLSVATGTSAASVASVNALNEAQTSDLPVIVAKISAPTAVDAAGNAVETKLSADGSVVTLHVDHKDDESVEYPIAADPEYEVVYQRWEVRWWPEQRPETYVSHWAQGASYVGNWHPVYCQWGMRCSNAGAGWFSIGWADTQYIAYWPGWNWGPAYQMYWYPVYATRMVVVTWLPYIAPVESSAALAKVTLTGEEVYEAGDQDNGDVDNLTVVAAECRIPVPPCKRIKWTKQLYGQGGGHLRFRYCWNRTKHKVSLDSQNDNHVSAWVSPVPRSSELGSVKAVGEKFTPEVLWLNGYWRGALDAHAQFTFRGEVGVGPATIGKDLKTVDWGVVARYNGSYCAYSNREREKTCGV